MPDVAKPQGGGSPLRAAHSINRCTGHCHGPPDYTSQETYDLGLYDQGGHRRFNPPALLGLSQRSRFLHDGRAASLREVFDTHGGVQKATADGKCAQCEAKNGGA